MYIAEGTVLMLNDAPEEIGPGKIYKKNIKKKKKKAKKSGKANYCHGKYGHSGVVNKLKAQQVDSFFTFQFFDFKLSPVDNKLKKLGKASKQIVSSLMVCDLQINFTTYSTYSPNKIHIP